MVLDVLEMDSNLEKNTPLWSIYMSTGSFSYWYVVKHDNEQETRNLSVTA